MSLLEKLNLTDAPITERVNRVAAEKKKIREITGGLFVDADFFGDMLAHEIAETVIAEANEVPKPGSLLEAMGGHPWESHFGGMDKLMEFLTPFLADDNSG